MEQINLPILFDREKQEALNNALLTKTGCFLFLKTEEIIPGFTPSTYSDAFFEIVIGLYIVYHDLACLYWKLLLNKDFCPPGFEKWKLNKPSEHIKCIINPIRPQLTHGLLLFPAVEEDEFKKSLEFLNDKGENRLLPWGDNKIQWPRYMQMMTEDNWKKIVKTIIKDSDQFYELMFEWAGSWEKAISTGVTSPRHDFISSREFAKSIDSRVLAPYCNKLGIGNYKDGSGELEELRNHLRDFYEDHTNLKKPDRILKEMENWLIKQNQRGSSIDIARNHNLNPEP